MIHLTNAEIKLLTDAHRDGRLGSGDQFAAEARCYQLESLPINNDQTVPILLGEIGGRAYRLAQRVVKLYEENFK